MSLPMLVMLDHAIYKKGHKTSLHLHMRPMGPLGAAAQTVRPSREGWGAAKEMVRDKLDQC